MSSELRNAERLCSVSGVKPVWGSRDSVVVPKYALIWHGNLVRHQIDRHHLVPFAKTDHGGGALPEQHRVAICCVKMYATFVEESFRQEFEAPSNPCDSSDFSEQPCSRCRRSVHVAARNHPEPPDPVKWSKSTFNLLMCLPKCRQWEALRSVPWLHHLAET